MTAAPVSLLAEAACQEKERTSGIILVPHGLLPHLDPQRPVASTALVLEGIGKKERKKGAKRWEK